MCHKSYIIDVGDLLLSYKKVILESIYKIRFTFKGQNMHSEYHIYFQKIWIFKLIPDALKSIFCCHAVPFPMFSMHCVLFLPILSVLDDLLSKWKLMKVCIVNV
jgi:hypothetical protein